MHIVCPHCSTSYAINLGTLGAAGRTVRCSRCKEVWLARPEDAVEIVAAVPVMAAASQQSGQADVAAEWNTLASEGEGAGQDTPVVDSPSISSDWPDEGEIDWNSRAQDDAEDERRPSRLRRVFRLPGIPFVNAPIACAAMGALVLALVIWRADVVRLLPQTASFYGLVGLDVNLRGLMFKDVKVSTETVEGKPVLVIEGVITGETRKPVELPRLRFSVRDAGGTEIYAWNAVLEQSVLKPGERAFFKSKLASPPPEGRKIDIRFFTKRDLAAGSA